MGDQERRAGWALPRREPGRRELHERQQPVHVRLGRHELAEHPAEPDRLAAELRPHPLLPGRRRVALVEDEVEHVERSVDPRLEIRVGDPGRPPPV